MTSAGNLPCAALLALAFAACAAPSPRTGSAVAEGALRTPRALDPDSALCAEGARPELDREAGRPSQPLAADWTPGWLMVQRAGEVLHARVRDGGELRLGGERFELADLHVHPATNFDAAEVHLVHFATNGRVAVVAVQLVEGAHLPALDLPLAYARSESGNLVATESALDPADFLPADRSWSLVEGAPERPSCATSVSWLLLHSPREVAPAQLAALHRDPAFANPR